MLQFQVPGKCLVRLGGSNGSQLGYSIDGVSYSVVPYYSDLHSDDFGGRSAPPADTQLMGVLVRVRCELIKWDKDLCDKTFCDGVAGKILDIGTLMRQDGKLFSLYLDGRAGFKRLFPNSFVRGPGESSQGSRAATYNLDFDCWIDDPATMILFTQN